MLVERDLLLHQACKVPLGIATHDDGRLAELIRRDVNYHTVRVEPAM